MDLKLFVPLVPLVEGGKRKVWGAPPHLLPIYEFWGGKSGTRGTNRFSALILNGLARPTLVFEGVAAPPRAPPGLRQTTGRDKNLTTQHPEP